VGLTGLSASQNSSLYNGAEWQFDVGEMGSLDGVLLRIEGRTIEPTEEKPEVFWRTNGSKVIEVFLGKAYFHSLGVLQQLEITSPEYEEAIVIREGGSAVGYIPRRELTLLRRHIRILTEGAPYPRAVRLLDVVEEKHKERLIRVERFPLNNRDSKSPLRLEREFSQEMVKTIDIEASFGTGIDYYVQVNLETKFGLAREQRITESVKVSMEAEPGEHKEYIVTWKEVTVAGFGIFEINGVREKVPFNLKSSLIPDIRQEVIA